MERRICALPKPVPDDPVPLAREWLDEASASGEHRNPNAMALATVDAQGRPSARVVLLKGLSVEFGYAVFYTNYESRKGRELQDNAYAAGVLYWEKPGRQLRFEGPVLRSPQSESDAYFKTREWGSQINAWVSEQSKPLVNSDELQRRAQDKAREFGGPSDEQQSGIAETSLPRPPFWGGYRLWFEAVELWVEGADRFHERIRYERSLSPKDASSFTVTPWRKQQLQP